MNAPTFWWLAYSASLILIVFCNTWAGVITGAVCSIISIAGFAIGED